MRSEKEPPIIITPEGKVVRTHYYSVKKGIEWKSFPMRLWEISQRLFWSPIQFEKEIQKDVEDWKRMTDAEKEISEYIAALFAAGEESVARYSAELTIALDELGYTEEVLFLNQFQQEEARHTDAFRRWMDAVGIPEDVEKWAKMNNGYYELFYVALPSAAHAVKNNPTPENIVRFTATYMFSIEGIAAETGFYFWRTMWEYGKHLRGIYEIVKRIALDESRHVAFGTYLTTMLVSEYGEELYDKFLEYFNYAGGLGIRLVGEIVEYETNKWESQREKWGNYFTWVYKEKGLESLVSYAAKMVQNRLHYVNKLKNANKEKLRFLPTQELDVIESVESVEKYLTPDFTPS